MTKKSYTPGPWKIVPLASVHAIEGPGGTRITHLAHHFEHKGEPCGSIESQDKHRRKLRPTPGLFRYPRSSWRRWKLASVLAGSTMPGERRI